MLIVVAVLGILAAMALPTMQGYITQAKASTARDNLRIMREAIELYASQHEDVPPGYINRVSPSEGIIHEVFFELQLTMATNLVGDTALPGTEPTIDMGPYLHAIPENPFNNEITVLMIGNDGEFPSNATGTYGWIYQPFTKTIRLDWPGTDRDGVRYYDY